MSLKSPKPLLSTVFGANCHAMAVLGVEPGDTWMVGDNLEWEVAAPQKLGIFAIWFDGFGRGLPDDSSVKPDRIIRSLPELLGWRDEIGGWPASARLHHEIKP